MNWGNAAYFPESDLGKLDLPARTIPVYAKADVVVAGGGAAGLAAAISAARAGASTIILERYGFLGGNFTAASVGTVCGLYLKTDSGFDLAVRGFAEEFANRLKEAGAAMGPLPFKETAVLIYQPWAAKRIADSLVESEEGLRVLLHARVSEVKMAGDRIEALVVASKRGPVAVVGEVFLDCTGDADVSYFAGVPTQVGPPGMLQFPSMQFIIEQVDGTAAFSGISRLADAIAEHGEHLSRDGGALIPTGRKGEFIGAMTRIANNGKPIDATDLSQMTWGEFEGRRLAEEAFEFVKEHIAGFEESFLMDTPPQLGIRESRHINGIATLTGEDITNCARFSDAIATGAWPQEFHVVGRGTEYRFLDANMYYEIPYGCLLPEKSSNLLVAGRCISATHEALASTRVMAPSMALGQAAGVAAATAVKAGVDVAKIEIDEIQQILREQGAWIPEH